MNVIEDKGKRSPLILGQDGNSLMNLIAYNVVLFLILKFLFIVYQISAPDVSAFYNNVFRWFVLPADLDKVITRPWTIITHFFTDETFFHLLGNVLWLWLFGYIFQDIVGNKKLIPVYIYGGLAGAIGYLLIQNLVPSLRASVSMESFYGANAAVMSVAAATTTATPTYRIFPLIKGGVPLWVITIVYLLLNFSGVHLGDIALYSAHIMGALAGVCFILLLQRGIDGSIWINNFFYWCVNMFNPDSRNSAKVSAKDSFFYKVNGSQPYKKIPNISQERIDKILDRINTEGYQSLTDEEKDMLKRAANGRDL